MYPQSALHFGDNCAMRNGGRLHFVRLTSSRRAIAFDVQALVFNKWPASSMVEQSPFKRLVTGSSPVRVTNCQKEAIGSGLL